MIVILCIVARVEAVKGIDEIEKETEKEAEKEAEKEVEKEVEKEAENEVEKEVVIDKKETWIDIITGEMMTDMIIERAGIREEDDSEI